MLAHTKKRLKTERNDAPNETKKRLPNERHPTNTRQRKQTETNKTSKHNQRECLFCLSSFVYHSSPFDLCFFRRRFCSISTLAGAAAAARSNASMEKRPPGSKPGRTRSVASLRVPCARGGLLSGGLSFVLGFKNTIRTGVRIHA